MSKCIENWRFWRFPHREKSSTFSSHGKYVCSCNTGKIRIFFKFPGRKTIEKAEEIIQKYDIAVLITDYRLENGSGLQLLSMLAIHKSTFCFFRSFIFHAETHLGN